MSSILYFPSWSHIFLVLFWPHPHFMSVLQQAETEPESCIALRILMATGSGICASEASPDCNICPRFPCSILYWYKFDLFRILSPNQYESPGQNLTVVR